MTDRLPRMAKLNQEELCSENMIWKLLSLFNPSQPRFDGLFIITMLGEAPFPSLPLAVFLWVRRSEFGMLGLAILTSSVLNAGIKEVFQVPRPSGRPVFGRPAGNRWWLLIPQRAYAKRYRFLGVSYVEVRQKWVWVLACYLSVAVSRLPSWRALSRRCNRGMESELFGVDFQRLFDYTLYWKKEAFLLIFIPMYLGLYFVADVFYYKITGAATGLILGYLIERRYIQYQVQAGFGRQVCKIVLGLAGLVLVTILLKQALPETAFCDLLRYFLMGFWMTVLAPLLFKILFKSEKA